MDAAALRAAFPVLAGTAYLNAGTDGPVPQAAVDAAREQIELAAREGRTHAHFERRTELAAQQRAAYARLLGADPDDVALTTSTSEGIATVVDGLRLRPGDEIVSSDVEHPGVLGPLAAARAARVEVSLVPFDRIHEHVGARTRLVVTSHVSWIDGRLAPRDLTALGDIPVLLDGAQGLGAVPIDLAALGCAAYAASGQKWCCGPDGTGALWVSPALRERLAAPRRSYVNLADPAAGLDASLHDTAARFDAPAISNEASAWAIAALETLEGHGWDEVHARAAGLAAELAERLNAAGRTVAPRGATTLVAWESDDPATERERLAEAGVVVRGLPNTPYLRASVGAWSDEHDLDRLLEVSG